MSYDPERAVERRRLLAEIDAELATLAKKFDWQQPRKRTEFPSGLAAGVQSRCAGYEAAVRVH